MKVTPPQCCVMTPVTYAEYLGVPDDAPRTPEEYVVNYVDLEASNRCKVSGLLVISRRTQARFWLWILSINRTKMPNPPYFFKSFVLLWLLD